MGSTRRSFTEEYKDEAVRFVIEGGRSIAEVARNIGVHEMTLGKWVKKTNLSSTTQSSTAGANGAPLFSRRPPDLSDPTGSRSRPGTLVATPAPNSGWLPGRTRASLSGGPGCPRSERAPTRHRGTQTSAREGSRAKHPATNLTANQERRHPKDDVPHTKRLASRSRPRGSRRDPSPATGP